MAWLSLWRKNYVLLFFIFIVALVLFVAFSYKIIFHDTWEYMGVTKKLAGYSNDDVFIVHSLVYSFFLSLFVRYFPSILTMKLINIIWIILIGFLLYKSDLKKSSFVIWVFSPIAWMMSPVISPIIPASFFFLVAYLSIKTWQENKKPTYFVISALSLGLTAAFYDLAIVLIIFFILAFFYDKKLKEVVVYLLFAFLSFSIRLIIDASLFSLAIKDKLIPFPFYSLIRFWGAILVINLGLHPMIPISKLSILNIHSWNFLILVSPLLFYFYKIKYKEHKRVIIFLILSSVFFIYQGGGYFYFILLAPIIILLLSTVFRRKELIIHIISSVLIIIFMTYPFFILDKQEIEKRNLIIKDLKMISNEFHFDKVVFKTDTLAMFYIWDKNLPYFISSEEYGKVLNGDNYYSQYIFELKPKIDTDKILEIKAGLRVNLKKDINYENIPWLIEKGGTPPKEYKLTKCYTLICVYEKYNPI